MVVTESRRPRVAVTYPGDATDPTVRSGTPYGVLIGLHALGVDVFPVDVRGPERLEQGVALTMAPLHQRGLTGPLRTRVQRGYSSALIAGPLARLRSAVGSARLRQLDVDAVVQLGAGYALDSDLPRVVYDDMTVAQVLRYPYPSWESMRRPDVEQRLAMQAEVYRSATACGMTSSWAARSALDNYDVDPAQVRVVGAGTHERPRAIDRDWSDPRYLFVGLDFTRKNGPRVLRAFAQIHDAFPAATLDVVGGHPPIDQPGVRTYGRVLRSTPQGRARLRDIFDSATCFVMPSLHEPAGVVFTEAAAAGLPSIGGTTGGSADFIGDGGVVVDPTDDQALLGAMLAYADGEVASQVGAVAASRSHLFTWPSVAGRLLGGLGMHVPGQLLAEPLPLRASRASSVTLPDTPILAGGQRVGEAARSGRG